jgi:hypothetical protein
MISDLNIIQNIPKEDFQILHNVFLSLHEKYNERFIENLIDICIFEEKNKNKNKNKP